MPDGSPKRFVISAPFLKVLSKLAGRSMRAAATHVEVLAAGHTFQHPSAIFDEADLARITGTADTTNREQEIRIARGRQVAHGGSISYVLIDVLLHDGTFYRGNFRRPVGLSRGPWLQSGHAPVVSGGVLSQCWLGSKYFGHSLHEEAPLALLGMERGKIVGIERRGTPQQFEYLKLFGLTRQTLPRSAWVESLEILDDHAYSLSKVERWKKMRRMFTDAAAQAPHPGVFLKRGTTGQSRRLTNEDEIARHLSGLGFRVINPGEVSLSEIMAAVAGARVVVGVEGSQLVHGFLGVAERGSMLVIQPPFRFDNAYKERNDLLDIAYAFVVAHEAPGGFSIKPEQIDRGLEKLAAIGRL